MHLTELLLQWILCLYKSVCSFWRRYSEACLKRAYNRAKQSKRTELLISKSQKSRDTQPTQLVTQFCLQSKPFSSIINKHWHLLRNDPKVAQFVDNRPSFSYKKFPSVRDKLTQSHFSDLPRDTCVALPHGTFKCGFCKQCQYVQTSKDFILPNGKKFVPRHFVNCATLGVIYLITCSCGDFYVGKTARTLSKRIGEHIRDINTGNLDRPLSRRAAFKHGYKQVNVVVKALDHIHPNIRGKDILLVCIFGNIILISFLVGLVYFFLYTLCLCILYSLL